MTTALPRDLAFDGSVALVTGGSGDIGQAIGARLRSLGCRVVLASRSRVHGEGVEQDGLDVRDRAACDGVVEAVLARCGRLDVLVNNAGIMVRHGPLATTNDEWHDVLETNLTGAFNMSCAAFPALAASPAAAVINVTSTHAHLAAKGSTAYSVSKAGLNHLTRLLALEWAESNIRVNAVAPTVVPSAMTRDVLSDPAYIERKFKAIPLGQPVLPEEVAAAVAFLASGAAASTTGRVLVLDGGESLP